MELIDFIVLLAYFLVMIGIGLWAMRQVKDQEDYFLGGRGFGKLLQTFAAFGAGTGAHEPVTVGSTSWKSGLSGVWSALMWLFVTPIYWITAVWYRRMRHMTLGDWYVERYQSRAMGAAYTLFAIVFYMFYLSTMLSAISKFAIPLIGVSNVEWLGNVELQYVLIPSIALVVIVYGVLGGLTAAYWTDLIQGLFIILLSVLLIPYGLWAIAERFGGEGQVTLMDGFRIMHERVSGDYFSLFSGPSSGEFTIQYIVSLSILAMVGIVVQPHFIATGGGSAKSEDEARIGLVVGNFLKRLCTVGWALTALIALALLAGNIEIARDPDTVWGVAAREILGPLNLGLVGLMLACLLAAMMSSADTYMIVTSALVVRNISAPYVDANADEKRYVLVGRVTGLLIIVGAAVIALQYSDVFGQFKLAMELPILFAAPFWVGMYWRRVNKFAVWGTIAFSLAVFFVLPVVVPMYRPELRSNPDLAAATHTITKTFARDATAADVARREAWVTATNEIEKAHQQNLDEAGDDKAKIEQENSRYDDELKLMGKEPPLGEVGDEIEIVVTTSSRALFWRGGLEEVGEVETEEVKAYQEGEANVVVTKKVGEFKGKGSLNIDFVCYHALGLDLSSASKATLETLRLPPRLLLPFLVLILLSYLTPRGDKESVDKYFAKMNTPVMPDPEDDKVALERAMQNAALPNERKLFPQSDWEFVKPTLKDVVGFLTCCGVCGAVIGLLMWLAGIGS